VEFFIAGRDAAEGFEGSKEVLNAVAFAIEMLVKSKFGRTIGFRGYDGEAAELVHKSANRVAAVSFIYERMGSWLDVFEQERFGLIKTEAFAAVRMNPRC